MPNTYIPKVLVVDEDTESRQSLYRVLRPSMNIITAATPHDAVECLANCDILLLVWMSDKHPGGNDYILDSWSEHKTNSPMCVLYDKEKFSVPFSQDVCNLYIRGAYNVLPKNSDYEVLSSVFRHYARDIVIQHAMDKMSDQIVQLRRVTLALAIAVLGVQFGPEALKLILEIFV